MTRVKRTAHSPLQQVTVWRVEMCPVMDAEGALAEEYRPISRAAVIHKNGDYRLDRAFSEVAGFLFKKHAHGISFFASEAEAVAAFVAAQRRRIQSFHRKIITATEAAGWGERWLEAHRSTP